MGIYSKMNFEVPSKKEIKEKYNISDEDFDILVADELPRENWSHPLVGSCQAQNTSLLPDK